MTSHERSEQVTMVISDQTDHISFILFRNTLYCFPSLLSLFLIHVYPSSVTPLPVFLHVAVTGDLSQHYRGTV